MSVQILTGDCRDVLRTLPDESVHCVVTSPPYWGLRDYGIEGQLGLEPDFTDYIATMVEVFREVRRVLRSDGTLWLNYGDSFSSGSDEYVLRDDCSMEGLRRVALEMFGLRFNGDETASQGTLQQMLHGCVESANVCDQSALESRSVKDKLSATQKSNHPEDDRAQQENTARSDKKSRGQMRVLRRDSTSIPDGGSCEWGRSGTSETTDGKNESVVCSHLPRDTTAELPNGSLSNSLLELQLRDRAVRLLSSRKFAAEEIPYYLRCYFRKSGLKPKDLCGIPWRVAFALQADGWWLRSDIIWSKSNPMPESVTDRPTKAHEYLFLMTKSANYYYDAEAIREPHLKDYTKIESWSNKPGYSGNPNVHGEKGHSLPGHPNGRNKRTVWEIATAPFSEAHFATFPPALIEPCIKAGTSERGCCAKCGAPWVRQLERTNYNLEDFSKGRRLTQGKQNNSLGGQKEWEAYKAPQTLGWAPSCSCDAPTIPATILDCFGGAGTTGLVADRLQRSAILIELNPEYAAMARRRIDGDAPLFSALALPSNRLEAAE